MPDIRVAAIYDVHGNLPALEAALSAIDESDPDLILVGGDIAWGPLPRETVERLLTLGVRAQFIRGDADRDAVDSLADPDPDEDSRWCGAELTGKQRAFLATHPSTMAIDVDGLGPTLFCHGSPRSDRDRITAATPPEKVHPMLAGARERVIVCGHTHAQFDRQVGEYRIVNAGSVGLPFGERGAYWALLGPDVDLRRSDYDYDDAVARIRAKPGPLVDRFVERIRTPLPASTAAERWG
jgi:predicted phosphodiesterase